MRGKERFIEVQKEREDSKSDVQREGFFRMGGMEEEREERAYIDRKRERELRIDTLSTA